jgi:uncharacterized membrane protein YcfT
MMHCTLGVEAAFGEQGLLRAVVDFAAPFRIPAFFLMSGLLLSRTIDQSWPVYLDRKVAHFAYFYLLWLAINCVLKYGAGGPGAVVEQFLLGLVEPFGTLWFIYILPLFFVATKLARRWPWLLLGVALALNLLTPPVGLGVVDEFASRFIFFVAGYLGVRHAFALAKWTEANMLRAAAALALAAAAAGYGFMSSRWGISQAPGMALALGFIGSAAVITASSLLARLDLLKVIRTCGEHSLTIYLAFFLPMAATRALILRFAPEMGPTAASVFVTLAALALPFVLERLTRGTPLRFLFRRPRFFHLPQPSQAAKI